MKRDDDDSQGAESGRHPSPNREAGAPRPAPARPLAVPPLRLDRLGAGAPGPQPAAAQAPRVPPLGLSGLGIGARQPAPAARPLDRYVGADRPEMVGRFEMLSTESVEADVFKAEDSALKVFKHERNMAAGRRDDEFRILSELHGKVPGLVPQPRSVGEASIAGASPRPSLEMEFLPGDTLQREGNRLDTPRLRQLSDDAGALHDAMTAVGADWDAHTGNMMSSGGRVRFIDFKAGQIGHDKEAFVRATLSKAALKKDSVDKILGPAAVAASSAPMPDMAVPERPRSPRASVQEGGQSVEETRNQSHSATLSPSLSSPRRPE